jgi:hypothetical protein
MNRLALIAVSVAGLGVAGLGAAGIDAAAARTLAPAGGSNAPPFTATLSNNTPLVFGMDAEAAARALGTSLNYISGRRGDETLLAFRNVGGSGLFFHKDRLYLQFRKGRLTGWKGDWGHNWMWQ